MKTITTLGLIAVLCLIYFVYSKTHPTGIVSKPLPGVFVVIGVTGGPDTTPDNLLEGTTIPTLNWKSQASSGKFAAEIFDSRGASACAEATVSAPETKITFNCTLTPGKDYVANLVFKSLGGDIPADGSPFAFHVKAPALLSFDPSSVFDFNVVRANSSVPLKLVVRKTGDFWATNLSAELKPPFSFLGGKYPGNNGTCGDTILKDCLIYVAFSPTRQVSSTAEMEEPLVIRYNNGITSTTLSALLKGRATPTAIKLQFTTGNSNQIIGPNFCGPIFLYSVDASGKPATVVTRLPVRLSVASGNAAFYGDKNCTTRITTTTIVGGNYSTTAWLKSGPPQRIVLSATSTIGATVRQTFQVANH
ncbi:MAG: hypothetical protein P4M08_10245 [Oligoflexia bacterium]|nr:hypothetical protein [Oligoflexia bacterium]